MLQLLGKADLDKIIRMQFARMRPGTHIKTHRDHGKWAMHAHRLHVPVTAAPDVMFMVRRGIMRPAASGLAAGALPIGSDAICRTLKLLCRIWPWRQRHVWQLSCA